ncbi:hypothetical protein [Haloarcula sp. 1CSR25-25]|jgi:hypothetical protein|uniref:hypothetical protein n=1 Tax=Haloarcula TaxID=2237 RepID=UPI002894B79D|nr:hypothetical protein [Haloarcula sp. 1CSR25-25]MDT3437112.1 hypothetical protein [Haloarcula sp. 1CSR25-25]
MSVVDTLRDHVRDHKRGMFVDLVFAIAWVTAVSVIFDLLSAPQWAYYLTLAAGVVAYYGFFWSLELAMQQQQ